MFTLDKRLNRALKKIKFKFKNKLKKKNLFLIFYFFFLFVIIHLPSVLSVFLLPENKCLGILQPILRSASPTRASLLTKFRSETLFMVFTLLKVVQFLILDFNRIYILYLHRICFRTMPVPLIKITARFKFS